MSVEQFVMRAWGYADFSVTGSLRRVDGGDRGRVKAEIQEIHDLALRAVPNDVHHR